MSRDLPSYSKLAEAIGTLSTDGGDVGRSAIKDHLAADFKSEHINTALATFVSAKKLVKNGDSFNVVQKSKGGGRERKQSGGGSAAHR
eukprot:gene9925-10468_t